MLKIYIQVLLRLLNSYISNLINFLLTRFVNVKKTLNPDSIKKNSLNQNKGSEEDISKWIGTSPKFISPKNIIVTYPPKGYGPEIIFGLRIFSNYEGKTLGYAYNMLLSAILVNVKNLQGSAKKPFLFAYLFKEPEADLSFENLYLYIDNKVYFKKDSRYPVTTPGKSTYGLAWGEFLHPNHQMLKDFKINPSDYILLKEKRPNPWHS